MSELRIDYGPGYRVYAKRHLDMSEPYWGGTLDARCEDKEGAMAEVHAFLAAYEMTKEPRYLDRMEDAMSAAGSK